LVGFNILIVCDKFDSGYGQTLEDFWGYATNLFAATCDYVSFVTTYQLNQIWGGFAIIL
jgi:hypothetical protein